MYAINNSTDDWFGTVFRHFSKTPEKLAAIRHKRILIGLQKEIALTYWGRDKLAGILADCTFLNEKFWILIQLLLKFIPKGPIGNKTALVQVMARHQIYTSHYQTNAALLLFGRVGTNFSENLMEIQISSFKNLRLKVSSAKWPPFCSERDELRASFSKYQQSWIVSPHWSKHISALHCHHMSVMASKFMDSLNICSKGDKILSEPMMVSLLTCRCVTQPQWVN